MDEENISDKETTSDEAVDDRGTNQSEGRAILKRLRDNGFESSDEKLAVALGRPRRRSGSVDGRNSGSR